MVCQLTAGWISATVKHLTEKGEEVIWGKLYHTFYPHVPSMAAFNCSSENRHFLL